MLPLVIFFVLGVALGWIGLRLLGHWESDSLDRSRFGHWHRH